MQADSYYVDLYQRLLEVTAWTTQKTAELSEEDTQLLLGIRQRSYGAVATGRSDYGVAAKL